MVRSALGAVALLAALTVTLVDPAPASAQVVRVYRAGWRRPYRYWRVGVGWVWVYPPAAVLPPPPAPPAPPPPPAYAQQEPQCGQCGCCCCNAPAPAPAPMAEPLPPPPPPPVVAPPPSAYDYQPAPRPWAHHELRFGLGVSGTGFNWTDGNGVKSEEGGATAHLRLRPSGHVTWEFALGAMGGKDENGIERHDVPATVGLMLYPWASTLAPYVVLAGGGNFIHQDYMGQHRDDSQALGALGLGLELRLGQHFAVGFDVRHEWRWATEKSNTTPTSASGSSGAIVTDGTQAMGTSPGLSPVGDESGTAYNLSATYYF